MKLGTCLPFLVAAGVGSLSFALGGGYIPGSSVTTNVLAALSQRGGLAFADRDGRLLSVMARLEQYPDLHLARMKAAGALVRVFQVRVAGAELSMTAVSDRAALDFQASGKLLFSYAPRYCVIKGRHEAGAIVSAGIESEQTPATLNVELDLPGARSMERTADYFEALIEMARLGLLGQIGEPEIAAAARFRSLFMVDPAANLPRAMAHPLALLDTINALRPIVAALQGGGESGKVAAADIVAVPQWFEQDTVFKNPTGTILFEEGRALQVELLASSRVQLNDAVRFYRPSLEEPAKALALVHAIKGLLDERRLRPDLGEIVFVNDRETELTSSQSGVVVVLNVLEASPQDVERLLAGALSPEAGRKPRGLLTQAEQDAFKASTVRAFRQIDEFRARIEAIEAGLGDVEAAVDTEALEEALIEEHDRR